MGLPLQGTPGVWDWRNPTLLPNFNRAVVVGNTMGYQDPATMVENSPRSTVTGTVTIAGTIATGDVLTLQATIGGKTVVSASYTTIAGDTLETIAGELALAFAKAIGTAGFDSYVTANTDSIDVVWNGPVANFVVLSATTTGSETFTLSPTGGKLTGGSGPVIATNNFEFVYNASTLVFWYGQPYFLGDDLIGVLLSQGMPIA